MNQPPPLRACSIFNGKKVLLIDIDPHQRARDVDATDNIQTARSSWRAHAYDLILLEARGHLSGEARDFYREVKHASLRDRIVFLVGPPTYLSLTWPTDSTAAERGPQQLAGMKRRLVTAA